jgi:nitronate monooxygenase
MVLKTRVTEMLGIKHPIIQGGMHYVGFAELAAAVSNAGGLGVITALTQPDPESLRAEIRKCRALTNKPFGVNITLLPALVPPNYDAFCQVVLDEKVPIVETAGNKPDRFIELFKKHGVIVIHKCVSIRHALSAVKYGADIISMDGFECAGHPGEDDVGNFVLLAIAGQKLSVPFVASGGVGTGSQLAAALALGADGVNMGTRFMATKEAPIHDGIKTALVNGDERSTTHVFRSLKNTERVYRNPQAAKVQAVEKEKPGDFASVAALVKGALYRKSFQETGNTEDSVWSCGQVMGLIDDVPTCQVLIERMVAEAEQIMSSRLPSMLVRSKL